MLMESAHMEHIMHCVSSLLQALKLSLLRGCWMYFVAVGDPTKHKNGTLCPISCGWGRKGERTAGIGKWYSSHLQMRAAYETWKWRHYRYRAVRSRFDWSTTFVWLSHHRHHYAQWLYIGVDSMLSPWTTVLTSLMVGCSTMLNSTHTYVFQWQSSLLSMSFHRHCFPMMIFAHCLFPPRN